MRLFKTDPLNFKIHASLCIHRTIDSMAMDSLLKLLCWPKPRVSFSRMAGDALIDRARSQESTYFYKETDADVLLFVDDDIVYEPEDAIKICKEAYEKQSIVGGAYVNKKEQNTWITSKLFQDQEIIFSKDSPVTEVRWVATGFMAIHRNVFMDLLAESSKFPLHHPNHFPLCHPTDLKYYNFFKPCEWQHKNGDFLNLSEDWAFCEKARNIGYRVFLDPSIRLGHAGRYVYTLDDLCRAPRKDGMNIKYIDKPDLETSKVAGEKIEGEVTISA